MNRAQQGEEIVEIYDGLDDLKLIQDNIIEDHCDDFSPEAFHFFPEAYENEDWNVEYKQNMITPDELITVAG